MSLPAKPPIPAHPTLTLPTSSQDALRETSDAPHDAHARYSLTAVHGQGGLGTVWIARDRHLNRDVALKELKLEHATQAEASRRFIREAQVTGQLEHPNIVPVYELSWRPQDDQPFYTMKLVRGQTLRDTVAAYHQRRRAGDADLLDLRRLLQDFLSVANAVGYAHSRGVVHRDLKTENIVVGEFGEVSVLDWGLAKLLKKETDNDGVPPESVTVTADANSARTMDGHVLGTPAYMAPEQAAGKLELIDQRTDIYGLGAILFEILAGQPPHHGANTQEVLRGIVERPTPRTRSLEPRTPAALDAICAKAMAHRPCDRYAQVAELTEDIVRWLADEPVSVWHDPWPERLARWARRHRTWAQAAAASLLAITLVSAAAGLLIRGAYRAEAKARVKAEIARDAEAQARSYAEQARQAEARARSQATRLYQQAREDVDMLLTGVSDGLRAIPGTQNIQKRLLQTAAQEYEQLAQLKTNDPELRFQSAWALVRLGRVQQLLGDVTAAEANLRSAGDTFQSLLPKESQVIDASYGLATVYADLVALVKESVDAEQEVEQLFEAARDRFAQIMLRNPENHQYLHALCQTELNYGAWLVAQHRHSEAGVALSTAVNGFERLVAAHREDKHYRFGLALAWESMAHQLGAVNRHADAEAAYQRAIDACELLVQMAPAVAEYLEFLANTRVILTSERLAAGRIEAKQALATLEQAIADYETLVHLEPAVPRHRQNHAIALAQYGKLLADLTQIKRAEHMFTASLTELDSLARFFPDNPRYRDDRAATQTLLGQTLRDQGRNEEALDLLEQSLHDYESLVQGYVTNPDYRHRLALTQAHLGLALYKLNRWTEAEQAHRASIDRFLDLVAQAPQQPDYADGLAWSYTLLGNLRWQRERKREAADVYRSALAIREALVRQHKERPEYAYKLAWFLVTCEDLTLRDGLRAVKLAGDATELGGHNGAYWNVLGISRYRAGDWKESLAALNRSIQIRSGGDSSDFFFIAMSQWQLGELSQARASFDRGIQWMNENKPDDPDLVRFRAEAASLLGRSAAP